MSRKITVPALALSLMLLWSSTVSAAGIDGKVDGYRSINNESKYIDYKLTDEELNEIFEDSLTEAKKEKLFKTPLREIQNLIKEEETAKYDQLLKDDNFKRLSNPLTREQLAWLVENNILSREKSITVSNNVFSGEKVEELYDLSKPYEDLRKTEFLLGIYKSAYGVIKSRPLEIGTTPWRDARKVYREQLSDGAWRKYYDSMMWRSVASGDLGYLYSNGAQVKEGEYSFNSDHSVLVLPNVFELYLKELVDKNIVEMSTVSDMIFKDNYKRLGEGRTDATRVVPSWYSALGSYRIGLDSIGQSLGFRQDGNSQPLGRSYSIISDGNGVTVRYIKDNSISYFAEETLSSMEALKFVEKIIRTTEKDMTDTEATIVTYKYGANFSTLPDEDRRTVSFLTAKGILNFEDEDEYRNLYGNLTKEFAYKLMYRVANKDARLNFSEIQLTDSDNFWIEKGYNRQTLKISEIMPERINEFRQEDGDFSISPIPDIHLENVEIVEGTSEVKTSKLGFTYRRSRMAAPTNTVWTLDFKFDNLAKYTFNGVRLSDSTNLTRETMISKVTGNIVTFNVTASSGEVAASTVRSRIAVGTDYMFKQSGINAVVKYSSQSNSSITLVPASVFKSSNSNLNQKISIVEDKVLRNNETGTLAVLLPKSNIAIVGSHVVFSEDLMVKSIDGEVYYNLDIIKHLLSNFYVSELDISSMYLSQGVIGEINASVISSTGSRIGGTYLAKFQVPDSGDIGNLVDAAFANISQLSNSMNFMIRDFEVPTESGNLMSYKVILHLTYVVPDETVSFTNPLYDKDKKFSYNDVNNFLFERPTDPELRDWWDNNIEMSNAFMNTIYDTTGVNYIQSGYLVPNVTILFDEDEALKGGLIGDFFVKVGSKLSSEWVDRFIGTRDKYNLPRPANEQDPDAGVYYPIIPIPSDTLPVWVHAMFNNTGIRNGSKPLKNTTLWRTLMQNRSMSIAKMSKDTLGVKSYQAGEIAYRVSKSGSVFREILGTDKQFPARVVMDGRALTDLDRWNVKSEFQLKVKTRTEDSSLTDWVGKEVTIPTGERMYLKEVDGMDFVLVDKHPRIGLPVLSSRGKLKYYDIKTLTQTQLVGLKLPAAVAGRGTVKTRYEDLRKIFTTAEGFEKSVVAFDVAKNVTTSPMVAEVTNEITYVDGNYTALSRDKRAAFLKGNGTSSNLKTLDQVRREEEISSRTNNISFVPGNSDPVIRSYVSVRVDSNQWMINNRGAMVPRKTYPFLQIGNVYFSGINQTMIDSMVYKEIGAISVNSLPDRSNLLIGDMQFTKVGDQFVSNPQTSIKSWSATIKNATNKDTIQSDVLKNLVGYSIYTGKKKDSVYMSNVPIPLASFVRDINLGVPVGIGSTYSVLGLDKVGGKPVVYSSKANEEEILLKTYSNKNVPAVDAVVVSFKLDSALIARKVNEEGTVYQLLMSNSSLSEGSSLNLPFFNESLSISSSKGLNLRMDAFTFKPLAEADSLIKEYRRVMTEAINGDIILLIRKLLILMISTIVVLSTIAAVLIRTSGIRGILEAIRYPSRVNREKGPDLIKILTLGLVSIDSDVRLARLVGTNLSLVLILWIVLRIA